MTDPLDDLKRAFEDATPEPDAERRKMNLARAQELFDRVQDSEVEQRRTDGRTITWAGIEHGVRHMLNALTSRPVLATAGVVAAVGLTVLLVTATRDETPRSSVVVADAGVAPAPVASPPGVPEGEREATSPAPESSDEAGRSTVGGRVVDDGGEPVPGVSVTLSGASGERFGLTDNSGSYRFPDVAPGDYSVKVALEGMGEADAAVRAAAGDLESVDFTLQAAIREGTVTGMSPVTVTAEARAEDEWSALSSRPGIAAPPAAAEPPVVAEFAVVAESAARESRMRVAAFSAAELPLPAAVPPPVDVRIARPTSTEAFANEPASPVKVASEEPVSTFSIDVDTASYSVVRSSLMNGYLPSRESVRIEELINYFPYAYPAPGERGAPFRPTVTVSETPWNPDTLLMHVGIQGRLPATDDRPPLNLVFLIDTSGSMDQPNKLPLLKQSFRLMLGQLDPADEVAIVTYAGSAGLALDATASSDRGAVLAALDRLRASGSTAGAAGIQLAYETAGDMAADGEVTRVILATDGDFNVGISDPEQLEDFIARQRDSGVYLSVLGFGRGNLDDATMQALAQNGNGQAATIDTLSEAQKVLVDQLVGTLFPIADDVKIQVEFNPAAVAEYRLIGYETRSLRREDFSNDRVDAGEIGAGHSVTAIYEVTPVGSPAVLHEALRYADRVAEPPTAAGDGRAAELAFLRLRYKEPGEAASRLIELPIVRDAGTGGSEQGFAAAIAGFGQLLRGGVYTGGWSFADAIALAEANTGADRFGYRREAVTLMRLAESLVR
ncbi:MAG: von Willebrand factor type A domain-containing protein [Acidobacteria bacterium]|nr:von Willebrand factor type A domain-containing protein [Acidobacteriota bacterium]